MKYLSDAPFSVPVSMTEEDYNRIFGNKTKRSSTLTKDVRTRNGRIAAQKQKGDQYGSR